MSNIIKSPAATKVKVEDFKAQEIKAGPVSPLRKKAREKGGANPNGPDGHKKETPKERMARLEREAYQKGFEQGQRDGMALGEKKLQEAILEVQKLGREIGGLKAQIYKEAESEIVKLSMEIAKKIVRQELMLNPEVVVNSVRAALEFLTEKSRVRILINPQDMELMSERVAQVATEHKVEGIELVEDETVERGGCLLETGFGRINAGIEEQLKELSRLLDDKFLGMEDDAAQS